MANTIARLGVRLGIDSAEFVKGIEEAKKNLSEFASQAKNYGMVAATAFAGMTYKALEFADAISDVATANEVAISTVLQLSEALSQNGGNAENASKMLSSFTAFVDKAATGSFEAQKSFKDVGITLKDLGTMSMEQLFAKTLKGLEQMPDTLTRNARAMEMFGKAAKGVAIGDLARDMDEVTHVTEVQAQSVKDAGDAWDKLHKMQHESLVSFTEFIGTPALRFLNWIEETKTEMQKLNDMFDNLGRNMKMLYDFTTAFGFAMFGANTEKLKKFNDEYARFKRLQELGKFDTGPYEGWMPKEGATSAGRQTKLGVDPEARKAEALRLQQIHFMIAQRQKEGKEIEDNTKRMVEAFATEVLRQDAIEKTLKDEQTMFALNLAGKHMRAEDFQLIKDIYEVEQKREKNVREIRLNNELNLAAQEQLIDRENQLAEQAKQLAQTRNDMLKAEREGTFGKGFQLAMHDYFMNAKTEMEQGQMFFESVMGNMNAALDNFARTGKMSFKSLAQSIIQDLIAIQLKAQAMSMFKGLGLGSLFGLGGSSMSKSAFEYGIDVSGMYADGGDPAVGQVSLVGERGPELFVPKTAGTIIPNNMLNSMGSNQPSITYNGPYIANMSAIDTQSATQFLAKNKSAVWAANQTAQRSLPQSR